MPTAQKLNGTLRKFIEKQHVFFVATADREGRVNLSPKGMDSLRIKDDNRIVWLSVSGSGNETAAHVRATERMTMMFCSFEGDPLVLRVYGKANVIHPRDATWDSMITDFPEMAGSRNIFDLNIDLVQTSCGTGVPIMPFESSRGEVELLPWYDDLGQDGVKAFWQRKNVQTLDGKPTHIFED